MLVHVILSGGREEKGMRQEMSGASVSGGLSKTGENATQYPKEHRTDAQQQRIGREHGSCPEQVLVECLLNSPTLRQNPNRWGKWA